MRRWALVLLVAGAVVGPAPDATADVAGAAKRRATETERAEIAAAAGVEPQCIDATISTVDPQWAVYLRTNIPSCPPADGFVVVRRGSDGWHEQFEEVVGVSGLSPCPIENVPTAVALDLALCRRPRSYIICWRRGRTPELRPHPARCISFYGGFVTSVNLVDLRWRGWGQPVARARGVDRGFHLPFAHIRVRVTVYRRRHCPSGDLIYTRLRATSRSGSTVVRYPQNCRGRRPPPPNRVAGNDSQLRPVLLRLDDRRLPLTQSPYLPVTDRRKVVRSRPRKIEDRPMSEPRSYLPVLG
jgi:hypothetical protein